jgi:hypothetical protein
MSTSVVSRKGGAADPPLLLRTEFNRPARRRDPMAETRKQMTRIVYSIDKMSKRADEQWVRLMSETDPSRYVGPGVACSVLVPAVLMAGLSAMFFGAVPAAVVFVPFALINTIVLGVFLLMLRSGRYAPPLYRDNFTLVLFVVTELSLVAQSAVYFVGTIELVEIHLYPVLSPNLWLVRYLNTLTGTASMGISVAACLCTFVARPTDTSVAFLNLDPGY